MGRHPNVPDSPATDLEDALAVDADGDGVASPGDTLEYTATLDNLGNTGATDVGLTVPVPAYTTGMDLDEVIGELPAGEERILHLPGGDRQPGAGGCQRDHGAGRCASR